MKNKIFVLMSNAGRVAGTFHHEPSDLERDEAYARYLGHSIELGTAKWNTWVEEHDVLGTSPEQVEIDKLRMQQVAISTAALGYNPNLGQDNSAWTVALDDVVKLWDKYYFLYSNKAQE